MSDLKPVLWMSDPLFGKHDPGVYHPEKRERFYAIEKMAEEIEEVELNRMKARRATLDELLWVHGKGYIDFVNQNAGRVTHLDPDTGTSEDSVEAAYLAAGAAVEMAKAVIEGDIKRAFGNLRPPGHHAEANRAMGFCIFNNAALVAEYAVKVKGFKRVAVIDPDGHHGNGTQKQFYRRSDVLYASIHRWPFYPGTGTWEEVGTADGEGFNINFPFSTGANDADFMAAFNQVILPVLDQFEPQLIVLSAGFDAHEDDPLVGMDVTTQGFQAIAEALVGVADKHSEGRLVACLEGGYDLDALADSVRGTLRAFAGEKLNKNFGNPSFAAADAIERTKKYVSKYWKL